MNIRQYLKTRDIIFWQGILRKETGT